MAVRNPHLDEKPFILLWDSRCLVFMSEKSRFFWEIIILQST